MVTTELLQTSVVDEVRQAILSFGDEAVPWLPQARRFVAAIKNLTTDD